MAHIISGSDENTNILMMLFQEHHRQLVAKRQKIHAITERTLALFLVIAGWLLLSKDPLPFRMRLAVIALVMIIAIST
jgi:hypothetical protein